jgi:hypothetical protein
VPHDRTNSLESFSLDLYRRRGDTGHLPLVGLSFEIPTDRLDEHVDPVLNTLPAKELDYGHLFAYCFRRFGFPNVSSDSYKDIAQWLLTTPHRDMILCVRPSVLPEPHFSLFFQTSRELATACTAWERADVDAWIERKLDWAEAQGLPEWMDEFLASFQKHQWPAATWRDAYCGYIAMFTPRAGNSAGHSRKTDKDEDEHQKLMTAFAAKVAEYELIEPRPAFRKRSTVVSEWSSADPKKPLALAAIDALRDLQTGVRIRDAAINAYGRLEDGETNVVCEADSAGSGVGDMINQAPEESAELFQFISRLGDRNVQTGISRLLRSENCEVEPQHPKQVSQ